MTGAPARTTLYTPDLLALAVSLAEVPLDPELPLRGDARSATCGGSVMLGCAVDSDRRVARVGLRASACAVGQAAAALFALSATGRDLAEIERSRIAIGHWLSGGPLPDWPGLDALAPALGYPARHGAITLAWDAARAALSKDDGHR